MSKGYVHPYKLANVVPNSNISEGESNSFTKIKKNKFEAAEGESPNSFTKVKRVHKTSGKEEAGGEKRQRNSAASSVFAAPPDCIDTEAAAAALLQVRVTRFRRFLPLLSLQSLLNLVTKSLNLVTLDDKGSANLPLPAPTVPDEDFFSLIQR